MPHQNLNPASLGPSIKQSDIQHEFAVTPFLVPCSVTQGIQMKIQRWRTPIGDSQALTTLNSPHFPDVFPDTGNSEPERVPV